MDGNITRLSDLKKTGRNSVLSEKISSDFTIPYTKNQNSNQISSVEDNKRHSITENVEKKDMLRDMEVKESQVFGSENIGTQLTKEDIGKELKENNERIVEYILCLRQHRDELIYIIEKQYKERKKLETEMERITYKLCLINKSMAQRIKTKNLYDETIKEIECNYCHLIKDSEKILGIIKSRYEKLESMINKKTSTDENVPYGSKDDHASGEHGDSKNFKCPKLKSTLNKIGSKRSSTSNDSLT